MTSEAKIGLLLGLVVIFIIAFVVNGLPGFKKGDQPPAEGMELMAGRQQENPALGGAQRDVLNQQNMQPVNPAGSDPRTSMPLGPTPGTNLVSNTGAGQIQPPPGVATYNPPSNVPIPGPVNSGTSNLTPPTTNVPPSVQTAGPKTYTVQSGDSLASIAIKFYGPKEGNRKVNIDKIFSANKSTLRSANEIFVGQKLVIPPLDGTSAASQATSTPPSTGTSGISSGTTSSTSSGTREYVVVEGDSLWKIAASKLGDGSRYDEIVALNKLTNEDSLTVGMKLKLPAK
jgi:nucleoid-associated protein YgaU